MVDDDGSDSDSALSPGPEGESEAHHRLVVFIINTISSVIIIVIYLSPLSRRELNVQEKEI